MTRHASPCRLCDSREQRRVFWDGKTAIWECLGCGVCSGVTPDVPPENLYDEPYFRDHYASRSSGLANFFQAWLKRLGTPSGDLLDVGCGMGIFLLEAKARGWRVLGVDPSPAAIAFLRRSGLADDEAKAGDIQAVPSTSRFEVITFWDSLAHVPDAGLVLDVARRLLRPGGRLLVKTPWRSARAFRRAQILSWVPGIATSVLSLRTQVNHFDPEALMKVLQARGFREARWEAVSEVQSPLRGYAVVAPRQWVWRALRTIIHGGRRQRSFVLIATLPAP